MRRRHKKNDSSTSVIAATIFFTITFLGLVAGIASVVAEASNFISENQALVISIVGIAVAILLIFIINALINRNYRNKISLYSDSVNALKAINNTIAFKTVGNHSMRFSCDNEIYYSMVSPHDLLLYELVYKQSAVLQSIASAQDNKNKLPEYTQRVKSIACFNTDTLPDKLLFKRKYVRIERKMFYNLVKKPTTEFMIPVTVTLTNINGAFQAKKSQVFSTDEVNDGIRAIRNKDGEFYRDKDVWDAICRVERAKVTNKMRFSIYNRDGNRCRKCGSTRNLEVDHIFPVSKGGKSTYDNLQTLCHVCNSKKSNNIERGAVDPRTKRIHADSVCPICNSPLVVRNGSKGRFLGCSSYPNCKYTKNI